MEEMEQMNTEELLKQVNTAIRTVLIEASLPDRSRKLTRADLSLLRQMQKELQAEVNAQEASGLLDDTYVAFFDGR